MTETKKECMVLVAILLSVFSISTEILSWNVVTHLQKYPSGQPQQQRTRKLCFVQSTAKYTE